jgi:two-component system cell cycle sensor histidine kinase/response regulator CckA
VGESNDLFTSLVELIDAIVFVTETNGRMIWANAALQRQTGFRAEDFWFENRDNPFLHPDDQARVASFLGAFAASGAETSGTIDNRFIDKWGRVQTYRSTVRRIQWQGASALMFVVQDVGEAAPERDEESYQRIVEAANDGILKLSATGRVHFANSRLHEIVGLDAVQLSKRSFFELVAPAAEATTRIKIESVAQHGARATFGSELVDAAGERRPVEISASRLSEGDDAGLVLALVRDVSETRRIEEGLREAQKLESLGVFASGIAHDFNNVLTSILSSASLALGQAQPGTRLAEVIGDLKLAGERGRALTTALLAYVGRVPARTEAVDLRTVVRENERLLQSMIGPRISLDIVAAAAPVMVRGDAGQIAQVLVNLVTNGAEAITKDGKVSVQTLVGPAGVGEWFPAAPASGTYAVLRVCDTGSGVPLPVRRRIFDPFFSTKKPGRGLGLAVLVGIVRSHGGAVRLEPTLSGGTCFDVVFPCAADAVATAPMPVAPIRAPASAKGACVLVVDDDAALRKLGKWILEDVGLEAVVAEDGRRALAIFEADPRRFDAIVMDQAMPDLLGDSVVARMRGVRADLPVVYTSGLPNVAVGENDFSFVLAKPYTAEELQDAVLTVLERRAP